MYYVDWEKHERAISEDELRWGSSVVAYKPTIKYSVYQNGLLNVPSPELGNCILSNYPSFAQANECCNAHIRTSI